MLKNYKKNYFNIFLNKNKILKISYITILNTSVISQPIYTQKKELKKLLFTENKQLIICVKI
jgi:hypothetical protein